MTAAVLKLLHGVREFDGSETTADGLIRISPTGSTVSSRSLDSMSAGPQPRS